MWTKWSIDLTDTYDRLMRCFKSRIPIFPQFFYRRAVSAILYFRGISAVGSASHWQCGGQGFESPMLHSLNAKAAVGISPTAAFTYLRPTVLSTGREKQMPLASLSMPQALTIAFMTSSRSSLCTTISTMSFSS